MLNIQDYCTPRSIWPGIFSYVTDHAVDRYGPLSDPFTDDDLLDMLKTNARQIFSQKEYDAFRKAITALKKGAVYSLKKENLYRLCYALRLESDVQALDLFQNYLHQNEISVRSMDGFILTAALKLGLSWTDVRALRQEYAQKIASQSLAPRDLTEGRTVEMYYTAIDGQIQSLEDLIRFLDDPEGLAFFAKTRNTQYLALFDDIGLDLMFDSDQEPVISLLPFQGAQEKETIEDYYLSLFGLLSDDSGDVLSMQEISVLCKRFEHVFMTYDNFCLLVQRKRPVDISSGTFMLNLLKNLLTDEQDTDHELYVDFRDPEEFAAVCDDILIYFGFPALDPVCDSFDRLLMDVHAEILAGHPGISNSRFQEIYLRELRKYLRLIARA